MVYSVIRVGVAGAYGRMGSEVTKSIIQQKDMALAAAVGAPQTKYAGKDIGELIGLGKINVSVVGADKLAEEIEKANLDVLVDFTNAEAAVNNVKTAAEQGINLVVGTTGFSEEQFAEIEKAAQKKKVAAVISPNMAVGVNVFFKIVGDLAKILGDEYDIEVIEAHHKHKIDAPSGTALKASQIIADVLGRDLANVSKFGRKGKAKREKGEIGIHAIRAGDIVGEHTVLFAGSGERIELTHRAHSRAAFANGTLKAIRFVHEKGKPGEIHSLFDVLGLKPP